MRTQPFKNTGWTATGWIIPIFDLFKPYQIINEIYRAGSKSYSHADDWKKESGSGLLLTWWIFYAVTHLIATIISKQLLQDMWRNDLTLKQSIGMIEMSTVVCVISILISLLWFWVANLLTQRLMARSSLIASMPQSQYSSHALISATRPTQTAFAPANMSATSAPPTVPPNSAPCKPIYVQTLSPFDEEAVYAVVATEMDTGKMDKGLWTRLFAELDGDEKKTKIAYIKQRAERLIAAERLLLEQAQASRERAAETVRLEELRLQTLEPEELVLSNQVNLQPVTNDNPSAAQLKSESRQNDDLVGWLFVAIVVGMTLLTAALMQLK